MKHPSQRTQHGPWQQLDDQLIYDNPWISVHHQQVITPAGSEGIYGVVRFKNVAVGILPVDADGYTWLVKQYRYPLQQESWEIPEGGGPVDEPTLETAKRELEEETGLRADRWTELLALHLSNSVTDERAVVYLAEGLSAGVQALEDSEDIEVRRLPLQEAVAMAADGRITDAISVAALLRFARMRGL